ncbi:MAG: hypothetical protein VYD01_03135, partial [Pseudomonadota bacterium]|nr:hypothetical protein [Pseudomonadota bacterium]
MFELWPGSAVDLDLVTPRVRSLTSPDHEAYVSPLCSKALGNVAVCAAPVAGHAAFETETNNIADVIELLAVVAG